MHAVFFVAQNLLHYVSIGIGVSQGPLVILGEEKLLKRVVHIIGHRFHKLEDFLPS